MTLTDRLTRGRTCFDNGRPSRRLICPDLLVDFGRAEDAP